MRAGVEVAGALRAKVVKAGRVKFHHAAGHASSATAKRSLAVIPSQMFPGFSTNFLQFIVKVLIALPKIGWDILVCRRSHGTRTSKVMNTTAGSASSPQPVSGRTRTLPPTPMATVERRSPIRRVSEKTQHLPGRRPVVAELCPGKPALRGPCADAPPVSVETHSICNRQRTMP